jgi:hypothetical protein
VQHSGTILSALVGRAPTEGAVGASIPEGPGVEGGPGLNETEADEVEEHLRGLGYLE